MGSELLVTGSVLAAFLAGGVAHDFNNLLAAIRCSASLARRDATSQRGGTPGAHGP